jgi:hypothetical protein
VIWDVVMFGLVQKLLERSLSIVLLDVHLPMFGKEVARGSRLYLRSILMM